MKASKIITLILGLCVTQPIWFYLLYKILVAISASELMFFLYWIYLPAAVIIGIIAKVADKD